MVEKIEQIPDNAIVTRLIDFPLMYDGNDMIWKGGIFQFATNSATGLPNGESLNWDKYAPPPDAVHKLGCAREQTKRLTRPEMRYIGFVPAVVRDLRGYKNAVGQGFEVLHAPDEGRHHAEIYLVPNPTSADPKISRAQKAELVLALKKIFGPLSPHSCDHPT